MAKASEFRSFIFGIEDSLVSTVGLLSGIAIAAVPKATIILSGIVLIFVEAFSMGAGSFLSESSVEDLTRQRVSTASTVRVGVVMFLSYFFAGFIPLSPYIFLDAAAAFPTSILVSLTALFVLGIWSGSFTKISLLKSGMRMLVIGGFAIGIGVMAGTIVHGLTG
ncbi:MAG: hypothetical protein AMXMBFR16_03830 [Candidatus Uhrbacteria bacterium]